MSYFPITVSCRYNRLYSSTRTFASSAPSRKELRRRSTKQTQIGANQENGYKDEAKLLKMNTPATSNKRTINV